MRVCGFALYALGGWVAGPKLSGDVMGKPLVEHVEAEWAAEQIALSEVATHLSQQPELIAGLYSFSHRLDPDAVRQRNGRGDNRGVGDIGSEACHKGSVDLDAVYREVFEVQQ
ncbi:hypothetical protein GALL_345990 [mine drainage metagenome]|uniref:Uncharacterized protein n=1 Tax=mine drainage metagenome TaxID=410659 RepID=A0A1J5R1K5_9ZZZZ